MHDVKAAIGGHQGLSLTAQWGAERRDGVRIPENPLFRLPIQPHRIPPAK
jgi:hypothetical protein